MNVQEVEGLVYRQLHYKLKLDISASTSVSTNLGLLFHSFTDIPQQQQSWLMFPFPRPVSLIHFQEMYFI